MSKTEGFEPTAEERALLERAAEPVLEAIRRDRDRSERHIRAMLEYILDLDRIIDPTMTVRRWCEDCGFRNANIQIDFHRKIGFPPKHFLTRCRLEIARLLLVQTDLEIQQIALLVGYTMAHGFARSFKREHGEQPNRYRHRQQILAELGKADP